MKLAQFLHLCHSSTTLIVRLSVYLEVAAQEFPHYWPTFQDDFDSYDRGEQFGASCVGVVGGR